MYCTGCFIKHVLYIAYITITMYCTGCFIKHVLYIAYATISYVLYRVSTKHFLLPYILDTPINIFF